MKPMIFIRWTDDQVDWLEAATLSNDSNYTLGYTLGYVAGDDRRSGFIIWEQTISRIRYQNRPSVVVGVPFGNALVRSKLQNAFNSGGVVISRPGLVPGDSGQGPVVWSDLNILDVAVTRFDVISFGFISGYTVKFEGNLLATSGGHYRRKK